MHMVASTWDGRVYTVGSNEYGALGRCTQSISDCSRPGVVEFPFSNLEDPRIPVTAGHSHCAALCDGVVYLWGTFCVRILRRIFSRESITAVILMLNSSFLFFQDVNGDPFGLVADSSEKVHPFPVKLNLPVKIERMASGDNHLVLHTRESRGLVFTLGASLPPLGRPYEDRQQELRSLTLRGSFKINRLHIFLSIKNYLSILGL